LDAVPLLELVSEDRVDESVLLDDGQALELLRDDVESVHRAAASADVLDLQQYRIRHSFSFQAHEPVPFVPNPHACYPLTSNLTGFKPSFSILKTLSSFSSRKSGGSTVLVGASELYDLVVAKMEVLDVGCWKDTRKGARAVMFLVVEDAKARVREARIMMLREVAIVC
jgi:hypothetical protein